MGETQSHQGTPTGSPVLAEATPWEEATRTPDDEESNHGDGNSRGSSRRPSITLSQLTSVGSSASIHSQIFAYDGLSDLESDVGTARSNASLPRSVDGTPRPSDSSLRSVDQHSKVFDFENLDAKLHAHSRESSTDEGPAMQNGNAAKEEDVVGQTLMWAASALGGWSNENDQDQRTDKGESLPVKTDSKSKSKKTDSVVVRGSWAKLPPQRFQQHRDSRELHTDRSSEAEEDGAWSFLEEEREDGVCASSRKDNEEKQEGGWGFFDTLKRNVDDFASHLAETLVEGESDDKPVSRNSSRRAERQRPGSSVQVLGDWRIPKRFEIRHIIGSGSYGCVCEAYDHVDKRLVAVKRVSDMFSNIGDCKSVLREISILSKLNHSSIIRLYGVFAPASAETFDELYILTELVDSDLKKLMRLPIRLKIDHVRLMIYNLLVGVRYLHSAGIYHRDLKPANCLVQRDCAVKICDFGVSRAIYQEAMTGGDEPTKNHGLITPSVSRELISAKAAPVKEKADPIDRERRPRRSSRLTGRVGTRWYRAPELILLQRDYTGQIDVWSVGCIFGELLGMVEEPYSESRGPLFPGQSCFPLTPDAGQTGNARHHSHGSSDQLSHIFEFIGTPTEGEVGMLARADARRYLQQFEKRKPMDLKKRYPSAQAESLDFFKRLLRFDPQSRATVDEALGHPLVVSLRRQRRAGEALASKPITLDFEQEGPLDEVALRRHYAVRLKKLAINGTNGVH